MPGRAWRPEEVEYVKAAQEQGLTIPEIAAGWPFGGSRPLNGIRAKLESLGYNPHWSKGKVPTITRVVSETPERVVVAPEGTDEEPIEELWERAVRRTGRELAKMRGEAVAVARIVTDKPIALTISSDWHIDTSSPVDLPGLRAYADAVRLTPGAWAVAVGDLVNNNIKWDKQVRDVPDEWRLLGHILGTFGLKLLGITSGNHDDWTKAAAGVDALRWMAEKERVHFAPDELTWIVELVDPKTQETTARYVVATRHKFRRESSLNWTHACFRYLEERLGQWPVGEDGGILVPDIVAIGDKHLAAVEERDFQNKTVWAARMGPWQAGSSFSRALGFASCPPTTPTFLLYPYRQKRIKGFADWRSAFETLHWEREAS